MNHLARTLGISKKTLYFEFSTKEELLIESIIYNSREKILSLNKTLEKISNPIEALLFLNNGIVNYYTSVCPAFIEEVKRIPKAMEHLTILREEVKRRCLFYFDDGVTQSLFLKDQDYKAITEIFLNEPIVSPAHHSLLYITILRGVCTFAGAIELKHFCQENTRMHTTPFYENKIYQNYNI